MSLAIERHGDKVRLVSYARPNDVHCTFLAVFEASDGLSVEDAVAVYQAEQSRAMCFAREVGRSGLG